MANTYHPRVRYVDGFAGPGRYIGGEPGSPIIALQAALAHSSKLTGELIFLFIEEDKACADHLENEIAKLRCPAHFNVTVERGEFAEKLAKTLGSQCRLLLCRDARQGRQAR
jgi:three-Cys-motif partner protein